MAQPYIRFFGADWRADPCLRACGEASRGVWMDMLTFMMEAEPYGHFLVAPDLFCKMTVTRPKIFQQAVADLEKNRVFDRTPDGVIFSRRMVRDAAKADEARRYGKEGGNPMLVKARGKPHGVKGGVNPHPFSSADNPHGNGYGKREGSVGSRELGEDFE